MINFSDKQKDFWHNLLIFQKVVNIHGGMWASRPTNYDMINNGLMATNVHQRADVIIGPYDKIYISILYK